MSKFIVLSYITDKNMATRNLERTLKKFRYPYKFLGIGEPWKGFISNKIQAILKFCLCNKQYDLICVIDGYDMIASGPCSELIRKYNRFRTPIVFGGEKTNANNKCHTNVYKYSELSMFDYRKYLNAGFCIGNSKAMIDMYKWVIQKSVETGIDDDQKIMGMYMNKYPLQVDIDINSRMVCNTIPYWDLSNYEISNNRVKILTTMTKPCFLHFPANKFDMYIRNNVFGNAVLKNSHKTLLYTETTKSTILIVLGLMMLVYIVIRYITKKLKIAE